MSISAALFKRSRARKPGTSARCSIRRAGGGGSSLMARIRRGPVRFLPRRRPLATRREEEEDRLSALSDDLLLLILRRVNGRAAFGAGTLSRHWAHLPRELTALDIRVGDFLPPRYHRMVLLYRDLCTKGTIVMYYKHLLPTIKRYERRAMRAFVESCSLLLELQGPRRKVDRIALEFFTTGASAGCVNRLVTEAIDAWGVEDLEVVAKPMYDKLQEFHSFPSHGLCKHPQASHLRSLKLGGSLLPPLHGYSALAMLVLQGVPQSTPVAAYEGIFTLCPQLNTLHLVSCECLQYKDIVVQAPGSAIRELVVEKCFFTLRLRALPCLESLASLNCKVLLESTSVPRLRQLNLKKRLGIITRPSRQLFTAKLKLDMFFRCVPDITSLIVRFTGPDRWIVPSSSPASFLPCLRRLLVADVPLSWDVAWPLHLLKMAPSLEVLHIHMAPCEEEPGEEISLQPTELRLNHLKEFVVAGFQGKARQIYLVKFVVGVSMVLCHVGLFKNSYARDKGRWDWEMVTEKQSWTLQEMVSMIKQIKDGVSPLELVLG